MEHFNKHRSASGCIRESYTLFRGNMRNIFISTWKQLSLTSLLLAALVMCLVYTDANNPLALTGILALAALYVFGALVFFKARVFDMIDYRPYLWNVRRMEIVVIIALLIGTLLAAPIWTARALELSSQLSALTIIATWLVVAALGMPLYHVCLDLMMSEKPHPWTAYKAGMRHWGLLYQTSMLASLIMGVIVCIVSSPMAIAVYSAAANEAGIAAGDPTGLPDYFPVLLFVVSALTCYATLYLQTWQTFAMAFAYGSINYKQETTEDL